MTTVETELLHAFFAYGVGAFAEAGFTPEQYAAFLSRADVQAAMGTLMQEYQDETLDKRRQFIALKALARMAPKALRVIEASLDGPKYMRDKDGNIMRSLSGNYIVREAEPTSVQTTAARDVLDRLGVSLEQTDDVRVAFNLNVQSILSAATPMPINYDPSVPAHMRSRSRDRRREVMQKLLPHVGAIARSVDAAMNKGSRRRADATTS